MSEITLAICMYNAERYIEETLACIMRQTMQDFHLLIVNDCSTDGSAECVERFFEKNPRQYELVSLPENRGLCAGRRFAEEYASTKYLLFVDADDCPLPCFVEKLYKKIISDNNLMAVGCYLQYIDVNGKRIKGGIFLGETTKESFLQKARDEKLIFMASTSLYDREIGLSVGGHNIHGFPKGKPRHQDLCEDLDLWTRMSDLYVEGKAIVVIPEVLYYYRKGDGISLSSLGMLLRMRHIKTNLKRRRRGQKELSFIEFRAQMPAEEMRRLEKEACAADALRRAYYHLRAGHIIEGVMDLLVSIKSNPHYIVDKVKHNLLRMK